MKNFRLCPNCVLSLCAYAFDQSLSTARSLPTDAWRTVRWQNGTGATRREVFAALRLTLSAVRNFIRRIPTSKWIIGAKVLFEDMLDLHRDPPKRIRT